MANVPSQHVENWEGRIAVHLPKEISISGQLPATYGSVLLHQLFRTADDHEGYFVGDISLKKNGRFLFNHLASSYTCDLFCPGGVFDYRLSQQQLKPGTHVNLGDLTKGFNLSGCVTLDGKAASSCYIQCEETPNGLLKQAMTDATGRYMIADLPAGNYDLHFSEHSQSSMLASDKEVKIEKNTELNIELSRRSSSRPSQ